MSKSKLWTAALASLGLVTATAAFGAESSQTDLMQQINDLKSKVEQLEKTQHDQSAVNAKDIDETVERIIKDADRRSMLIDGTGVTSGYKPGLGFFIGSEDGNFLFHPWAQLDARYAANYREKVAGQAGDITRITENGFEIRRAKFGFDGNLFSPDITYLVNWATNRDDSGKNVSANAATSAATGIPAGTTIGTVGIGRGLPVLEEAWVKYRVTGTPFFFRFGQIKDPVSHEQIMSSKQTLVAERSLVSDLFLGGDAYIQAATAGYQSDAITAEVAFTDGLNVNSPANSSNNNFQQFNNGATSNQDYGGAGRIEYKVFGDWADYKHFTSLGDKKPQLLVVGLGANYSEAGSSDSTIVTADVQYNTGGLGLYAEYLGRYNRKTAGTSYDQAILGQVSYLFDQHWEVFGRYDYIHFNAASTAAGQIGAGARKDIDEITAGANYYLYGQGLKLTGDVTYLPNGAPADTGADILASRKNQWVFRFQVQLLI